MADRRIKNMDYIRERLRDMVNGDTNVDIGTLLSMLNETIEELGGHKLNLTASEIQPRFFQEIE